MLRVLVVEDDIVLAELIADGLREHDMNVDVVHDGAAAVTRAVAIAPDVVVLDRDLPVLHGDDVTRALIRHGSPRQSTTAPSQAASIIALSAPACCAPRPEASSTSAMAARHDRNTAPRG